MDQNKFARFAIALMLSSFFMLTGAQAQNPGEIDWRIRGYYGVTGLKSGDTLNVRDKSSARAAILGELGAGKVVFATGQWHRRKGQAWYQINHFEGLGWVNAAFLQKYRVRTIGRTRAPVAGSCGGWEPGWDVKWDQNGLNATAMSGPIGSAKFTRVITPLGAPSPSVIEFTNPAASLRMTLVLQDQQCTALPVESDSYQTGLLLVEKDGALTAYSGCCNPAPGALTPVN